MRDQADGLRRMVDQTRQEKPRIIAVTSGKGGVGKTSISVNLAISLLNHKKKVALLDADLGLANADLVLGVYPEYTLWHVLRKEKRLSEIITEGPSGLKIIAGSSGIYELANVNQAALDEFVQDIKSFEEQLDYLIVDTSPGLNKNVISFLLAVDEIFVVATSDSCSIADAYGLIKTVQNFNKHKEISIIANMVRSPNEGKLVYEKINIMAKRFLDYEVEYAGYILHDGKVAEAFNDQQPFILAYPRSNASRSLDAIATRLLNISR